MVQIVDVMPVQDLMETVVANLKLQAEVDRMLVVERWVHHRVVPSMVVMLDIDQAEIADLRLMVRVVAAPMVDIEKWDHHHDVQNMIAMQDIVRVEIAAAMRDLDHQNIVLITVI